MHDAKHRATVTSIGFKTPVSVTLPAAIRRIVEDLQPDKIVVFGSYAYGTPTPDSDVDLLVIMDTSAPPVERSVLVSRVLWPRPFPVDIIVRTPVETETALRKRDSFITEVITRGQVVYERSG